MRSALRSLGRSPGTTAVAVLMLALGLGASTAVFSVVNAILLKPVPFAEPDRLVMLMLTANGTPFFAGSSPAQFVHFESTAADTLEDIAAFRATSFNYTGAEASVRVAGAEVSEAYFRTLRAPLVQGRGFTREETTPGGPRLAVISHAAMLLAAIGIYAVMAYVVESRSREIGIRVALGAAPRRIRRLVGGGALRLVAAGLAIGLVGAYFLVALLRAVLYDVQPHDPFVFFGVPAALVVICLFSAAIPAVRAGRIARIATET